MIRWHRLGRIIAVVLALLFLPPAILMSLQGDHTAANNAMSVPMSWCALMWLLGVPLTEGKAR